MPKNHAVVNTMHCTCVDVDAYKAVGIGEVDMDNGTFVSLDEIANNAGVITGFEFKVKLPQANATGLWMVRTPVPGSSKLLEAHIYKDPRYFYNEKGEPMSLCYLNPGVDVIEVTGEAFADGSTPKDQPTYKFASVNAQGKLVVAQNAPAQGTYFDLLGKHHIDCGQELVPSYVLKCAKN